MAYSSLATCVQDLEDHGHLIRIRDCVDPFLEMAYIQRRVYREGGPAVLFENVKGSAFPAVCNLFGTMSRCEFMFRHSLRGAKAVIAARANPQELLRRPTDWPHVARALLHALPQQRWRAPVLAQQTTIQNLPQIQGWPDDGGPFITLPQVLTEDPERPSILQANVGMYRVQMAGNDYLPNQEVGLHYQIHRGIGVHHHRALALGKKLPVSIFVGGPPAHTLAAVMPLPEGLSELVFAGMLAGRAFRFVRQGPFVISADADFCITGYVDGEKLEGPFGDHLGYYSLAHAFPCLQVEQVFCRKDAIWPFTSVGRPPQEDTSFGTLIHTLTTPMVPVTIPGVRALHAVDAAGVHPLLLAIGSERYVPYGTRAPREILTQAHAILGFGQASLAKYLLIAAGDDDQTLDLHNVERYLLHILRRVRWERDLHFVTETTMDTLDYSGTGLNSGSKVVIAAAGEPCRQLREEWNPMWQLPNGLSHPRMVMPGVAVAMGTNFLNYDMAQAQFAAWTSELRMLDIPLLVIVDNSADIHSLQDFLWITFTRSNPSHDIYGVGAFQKFKHWGCTGTLLIDARRKPQHAPALEDDQAVRERVDVQWDRWFGGIKKAGV